MSKPEVTVEKKKLPENTRGRNLDWEQTQGKPILFWVRVDSVIINNLSSITVYYSQIVCSC